MKTNKKGGLFALIVAILGACILSFTSPTNNNGQKHNQNAETVEITTQCVSTNQTNDVHSATNTNDRGNNNTIKVDWFKDNSDYIWDGWKIK